MRTVYSIVACVLLALLAQSCGLKGPLRLPDRATPVPESGTSAPNAQQEKAQ